MKVSIRVAGGTTPEGDFEHESSIHGGALVFDWLGATTFEP